MSDKTSDRWVFQTRQNDSEKDIPGNALQAALASLMGLRLQDVPDFTAETTQASLFWELVEAFVASHGYGLQYHRGHCRFKGLYLAGGVTTHGFYHAVVMRTGVLYHDPDPQRQGLRKIYHTLLLVAKDPARITS